MADENESTLNDEQSRDQEADQMMVDYIMKYKEKVASTNFPENVKQINLCLVGQIAANSQIGFVLNGLKNTVQCASMYLSNSQFQTIKLTQNSQVSLENEAFNNVKARYAKPTRDILTISWPDSRSTFRNSNSRVAMNVDVDEPEDHKDEAIFTNITSKRWREFADPILDFVKHTKDNQEFDKGWKKLIKDHRSKLKEHEDKVFKELKRRLDSKMEQDKRLLTEGTFKTKNDHGTQKNLDNATYFPVYKTFIDKEFDVMYNAKRQYKGTFNQPEIHENKFKRKIKFRLWTYLLSKQQEHLTHSTLTMAFLDDSLMDVDDIAGMIGANGDVQQLPSASASRSSSVAPVPPMTPEEAKSKLEKVAQQNEYILSAIEAKTQMSSESMQMSKKNYFIQTSEMLSTMINLTHKVLQQPALVKQYGIEVEEISKNGFDLLTDSIEKLSVQFKEVITGEIQAVLNNFQCEQSVKDLMPILVTFGAVNYVKEMYIHSGLTKKNIEIQLKQSLEGTKIALMTRDDLQTSVKRTSLLSLAKITKDNLINGHWTLFMESFDELYGKVAKDDKKTLKASFERIWSTKCDNIAQEIANSMLD